jgi:hypothetical protein
MVVTQRIQEVIPQYLSLIDANQALPIALCLFSLLPSHQGIGEEGRENWQCNEASNILLTFHQRL